MGQFKDQLEPKAPHLSNYRDNEMQINGSADFDHSRILIILWKRNELP